MWHAFNDEPHFALENVNDLLLPMRMCRHTAPGGERSEHLIHRLSVCDCAAGYSGTNFNCWSFWFHFRILRQCVSSASPSGRSACRLLSRRNRRNAIARHRLGTRQGSPFLRTSGRGGVPAKLQICYQISPIALATFHPSLAQCAP